MDPDTPIQPQPFTQPPKRRLPQKKMMLILIGVTILILGIVLIVAASNKDKDSADKTGNSKVYYDRPGYDRSKLSDAIGDPAAVKLTGGGAAVKFQDNAVVQACKVLGQDDVTKQGLLLKPDAAATAISRAYNDGVGKGGYNQAFSSSISPTGLGMDVNSCVYLLDGVSSARVGVSVVQPFAIPESVVDEEIQRNYTAATAVGGLEAFVGKKSSGLSDSPEAAKYILMARGKGAVVLELQVPSDKEGKKQALLEAAAQNFTRELGNPTGPGTLSYDSPVFSKSFTRACDLTNNEDVRALSGRDAGALVREAISSSVGVTYFGGGDSPRYNYIENECTRSTVGGGLSLAGGGEVKLQVSVSTYLEDQPAKLWIEAQRHTNPVNKANMPVSGVGDEAVAYTDNVGDFHLIFRKGRVLVDSKLDRVSRQVLQISNLSAAAEKLATVSQTMASRVKN